MEKTIPHEHWCTVCKRPEACEDKSCQRDLWDYCRAPERAECREVYKHATVHIQTEGDHLACCGASRSATPGDRMTTDLARVTCQPFLEIRQANRRLTAGDPPTSATPGHVPGCLCVSCELANEKI